MDILWKALDILRKALNILWKAGDILRKALDILQEALDILRRAPHNLRKALDILRKAQDILRKTLDILLRVLDILSKVLDGSRNQDILPTITVYSKQPMFVVDRKSGYPGNDSDTRFEPELIGMLFYVGLEFTEKHWFEQLSRIAGILDMLGNPRFRKELAHF